MSIFENEAKINEALPDNCKCYWYNTMSEYGIYWNEKLVHSISCYSGEPVENVIAEINDFLVGYELI